MLIPFVGLGERAWCRQARADLLRYAGDARAICVVSSALAEASGRARLTRGETPPCEIEDWKEQKFDHNPNSYVHASPWCLKCDGVAPRRIISRKIKCTVNAGFSSPRTPLFSFRLALKRCGSFARMTSLLLLLKNSRTLTSAVGFTCSPFGANHWHLRLFQKSDRERRDIERQNGRAAAGLD